MNFSTSLYETLTDIADDSKIADAFVGRMYKPDFAVAVSYKKGELSYLPHEIAQRDMMDTDQWSHPQRVSGKVGRIARQLLREDIVRFDIADKDFDVFAAKLKASDLAESGIFELVQGDDVRTWYNERTYSVKGSGTLSRSCMRYDRCGSFMGIYTNNPDAVKMLILKNAGTGKLHGRALVWYTKDMVLMDRVYGNESVIESFRDYAVENGWLYKANNTVGYETAFMRGKKKETLTVTIPLTDVSMKEFPYMDTFKYLNKKERWISNDGYSNYTHKLESTDGRAYPR